MSCANRQGRPLAVLEAKRASLDPITAQDQGRHYAEQLGVPFVFLSNGEAVRFLDRETDAHARHIAGFPAQDDLERRTAARRVRRDLSTVAIDRKIVDRDYQIACIEALSADVACGRRKLLVRDGDRHRQDAHGGRLRQAAVCSGIRDPRAVPGGPDRPGPAGRGRLRRSSARLSLPCAAARPSVRPRQAHHDRDLADHDRGVPHAVTGLFRPRRHRRMPPLDLR